PLRRPPLPTPSPPPRAQPPRRPCPSRPRGAPRRRPPPRWRRPQPPPPRPPSRPSCRLLSCEREDFTPLRRDTSRGLRSLELRGRCRGRPLVLPVVLAQELLLAILAREQEEDERRAQHDRDDAGGIGPVRPIEERLPRSCGDRLRVLRVLLRHGLGAGERLRQLRLDAVGELRLRRRGGGRGGRGPGRRVAGPQQGAE